MPALEAIPFAREATLEGYLEGLEKLSGHIQEDSQEEDNVLTFVNTSMVHTSKILSLESTLAIVDVDENQKVCEKL